MLKLHHAVSSTSSWRVRIVLALKGVAYESHLIDFALREALAAHATRNPLVQVPCLETPGGIVSQSVAIVEYLEECHPEPALLPGDPHARARCRQIVEVVNSGIQPLHNGGINQGLREVFSASEDEITDWKRRELERRLAALERMVAHTSGRYCIGDDLSLADVFVYPQLARARDYGVDVESLASLSGVEVRLREHPEFSGDVPAA